MSAQPAPYTCKHACERDTLKDRIAELESRPAPQWTKKDLEDWCLGFCRTPHTTLKAFIDAGFCSDQEPSREELRLWPKRSDSTDSTTKSVISDLPKAIARLNRATWDSRVLANTQDVRLLLDAYRLATNPEPKDGKPVWYRGWEADYSHDAAMWSGEGWYACLGGADLDCVQVTARTWEGLLDEIDEHDMTEARA